MRNTTRLKQTILAGALAAFVTSCGSSDGSGDAATRMFHDQEVALVSDENLSDSNDVMEGTGTFKLVSPLATESQGGAHVGLTFELPEDGSAITLHTFASADLANGVSIKWTRSSATIAADGQEKDITSKLAGLDWSQPVSLRIDIHNNEDPTHLLIWAQSLDSDLNDSAKIFDSADTEDADLQVPGRGDGTIGGLALENAKVTNIIVSGPLEDDH